MSNNVSIVKVIDAIIDKKIDATTKKTTSNIVQRVFKTKSSDNAYTTFKDFETKIRGKSYSKGFIPVNSRATNNFENKKTMLYLANRYMKPEEVMFYKVMGITVDEESWAVSELVQWLWRGCIRNNEPMNIYIPSSRMRDLLKLWLTGDLSVELNLDSVFKITA